MEFDVSRVYTAVNAEQLKIGSKVLVADSLEGLQARVKRIDFEPDILLGIEPADTLYRFVIKPHERKALAYLVEGSLLLKWTDLKIGDLITNGRVTKMITQIDVADTTLHIFAGDWMSDIELRSWRKVND